MKIIEEEPGADTLSTSVDVRHLFRPAKEPELEGQPPDHLLGSVSPRVRWSQPNTKAASSLWHHPKWVLLQQDQETRVRREQ